MKKVAIVYHSGYGHTEKLAQQAEMGAKSVKNTSAHLFKVEDLMKDMTPLNDMDALIFGSPTYMGTVSAPMKAFMDASSGTWYQQKWKNKIAAGFTNSGGMSGDKFNSLVQLVTFAAQHSMIWVSLGLMGASGKDGVPSGDPKSLNRLVSFLGAMAQSDNKTPDITPPEGDLKTAHHLGKRVAEICQAFNLTAEA